MSKGTRSLLRAAAPALVAWASLASCFSFELEDREYLCESSDDCLDGYECRVKENRRICVPEGRPVDFECTKVYYTATGLTLTIHLPDTTTQRVSIDRQGLPEQGTITTTEGAYRITYQGIDYPVQAMVADATRLLKAATGPCDFKCVGAPGNGYNPATCVDGDCDQYGEGAGCRGADIPDKDGVVDANGAVFPGAPEICDAQDNDGDGATDGDDSDYAAQRCPKQVGVCQGATQTCVDGVVQGCDYGPEYVSEETEQYCDQLDNDCDGSTDENCVCTDGQTKPCGTIVGECERGLRTCRGGEWGECEGGVDIADEICDGKDNDCDSRVDEDRGNEAGHVCGETCPSYDTVPILATINGQEVRLCVDRWEASRRDPESPNSQFPASRPDAQPWTSVSFAEAQSSCTLAGKTLCPMEVWQVACGSRDRHGDGYPYGLDFVDQTCNGNNVAAGVEPAGQRLGCVSVWDGRGYNDEVGLIFDMSGNAREWVAPPAGSPSERWTMGGSYASPAAELTCVSRQRHDDTTRAADIGFRCCSQPR